MITVPFRVARASSHMEPSIATLDGEATQVQVPVLEVELVSLPALHGTLTLRFRSSAAGDAEALFVEGTEIPVTFGS